MKNALTSAYLCTYDQISYLTLHPLLHLHEIGRPHTQVGHSGKAAHRPHAERSLDKQSSEVDHTQLLGPNWHLRYSKAI